MVPLHDVVAREKVAVVTHRESLRSGSFPPPSVQTKGTFLHGFLLPFSLILATLRDRELRAPYLKTSLVRVAIVAALTALVWGGPEQKKTHSGPTVIVHRDTKKAAPIHVSAPGVKVDIAEPGKKSEVKVLGQVVPVEETGADAAQEAEKPKSFLASGWALLLAVFALVSSVTGVVIALSRRYDDWLGFGIAGLAFIDPEDEKRKQPKITIDFKWLWKKLKERIRQTIVVVAGMPVLALFLLVPSIGEWLFKIASVLWGYYWLGVFTAAKNDHSLADELTAPPPQIIRGLNTIAGTYWWTAPLRWYGRLWVWLTKSFNSPAAAFERAPAAFLGLTLARAVLSLPGLYILAKPIVPVAAGRLIAEADPYRRFQSRTMTPSTVLSSESFCPAPTRTLPFVG